MKKAGFTILELLVVISVLVILIGIAIPRFKGMQDAGKITQARAELQTMQTAVESYYINSSSSTKAYPGTSGASNTTIGASFLSAASPAIIPTTPPYDPFGSTSTQEYFYFLSGNGKYYVIASQGASVAADTNITINNSGTVAGKGTGNLCVTNGDTTGC